MGMDVQLWEVGSGDDGPVMLVVRICAVLSRIAPLEFVDHVCGMAFTGREGILDDPGVSIPAN